MPEDIGRRQVMGFRITRHRLVSPGRDPVQDLLPLGLQDTATGTAAGVLAVRLANVRPATLADLVAAGELVPTWGPRLAASLVAPNDELYISAALLDPDPDPDDMAAIVDDLAEELLPALREHGPMTKEQVGQAILPVTPSRAVVACARCGRDHPDDGLVKQLLWTNRLRLEASDRLDDRVAPAARWRPRRFRRPRADDRAEMVRRFLRLHGPATVDSLAAWAGISRRYAQQCWSLISGELADVMAPHGEGSVLADDLLLLLRSPRDPAPARLVPAYDPLLSTRDRWSLLPERAHQRAVWRAAANPGVVLSRDRIVGTWRARKKREQLQFTVTTFDGYTVDSALLEDDAHAIAVARGADEATLTRER